METAVIMALINAGVTLAEHLPALVAELKRRGELSEDQERALDKKIESLKGLPHWQKEQPHS